MKIEKYRDSIVRFTINLSMLLIFWGAMLRKSFNADTVSHMASLDADVKWNIDDGRYIIALADAVLLKLGIRVTTNLSITMLCAFLLFAATMLVIQKIYTQWQPEDKWSGFGYFCSLMLVFFNVLFSELLMFSECSVYFAFGYLMAALGVWCFAKNKYFLMVVCFLTSACTYQYTVVFAAILIAFYVCLRHEEKLDLEAVREEMTGILSCIGAGVCNLLSIKLFEKAGVIEEFNKNADWRLSAQKIADFCASFINLHKNSLGILPDLWIPLFFLGFMFFSIIYSCIKTKKQGKLPFIFLVFAGCMIMLYGIPFMQNNFSFPPRMAFCFYLLQGLIAVMAYTAGTAGMQKLLSFVCAGYLMIQFLFSDFVITNHFVSNTLDEVYVNMMYQEILKYEKETGVEVTKIAVYKDAYAADSYKEVNYHVHQINERTLGTATLPLIYKVTGRSFEDACDQEEVYVQYFKDKDWDYFDLSEQLIIIGDTAYWCIF